MKTKLVTVAALSAVFLAGAAQIKPMAQDRSPRVEFIDIRWDGEDRMCVVFPDGRVNFFGRELKDVQRPDDVNKRAF